jgi:hypothetical protein
MSYLQNVILPAFIIIIIFGLIIVLMGIIFAALIFGRDKHLRRKISKLLEKHPVKVSNSKEAKVLTKIKIGHYEALNNCKQIVDAIKKEIGDFK